MAGRRGCVNPLWTRTERVRIGERLKATLAGILELDLLRCKHLEMISAELAGKEDDPGTGIDQQGANFKSGSATCRRQQVPSPSEMVSPTQSTAMDSGGNSGEGQVHSRGGGGDSRWSTLSWDAPSDLLSPPTPDPDGAAQLDCDSRPSSGFYSVSGSSLSDSCYSVSSEAAQGGPGGPARPVPHSGALRLWEQRPLSADHADTQWPEAAQQPKAPSSDGTPEVADRRPMSTGDLELKGLMFLSDLCSGLGDPQPGSFLFLPDSSPSPKPRSQLDPRFCSDLVSRRTREVYPYPSPLHAVALQSPLFTCGHAPSPPRRLSPNADPTPPEERAPSSSVLLAAPPPSLTQLEQYITRLAQRHRCRVTSSLALAAPRTPRHGSTQSLTFESRAAPSSGQPGGSVTPRKSLLGSAGRVGRKANRNSINLGHLPSLTGPDLNISLHFSLSLSPGLNANLGLDPKHLGWEGAGSGSVGALRSDLVAPAASVSSTSLSTSTPAMRPRPRISTCPSSLNHRSSLEVTGSGSVPGTGSLAFSRSLDWSSASPGPMAVLGPGPGFEPDPKLSEDSAVVGEISRLSGLPRAVVIGLMEQGVELDVDCFQGKGEESWGQGSEATVGGAAPGSSSQLAGQKEPSPYSGVRLLATDSYPPPQRPVQLSLSVPRSGPTPPLSRSPQSASGSPACPYPPSPRHATHSSSSSSLYRLRRHAPSPSDPPSSTASSPASHPARVRSPPRPLQPSPLGPAPPGPAPLGPAPLSVFRRDAPSQCSLPHTAAGDLPLGGGGFRPRGGSLRQGGGGGGGWRRGEGLYQGKHASRELVRASTVSSFAKRESYDSAWEKEEEEPATPTPKRGARLWRGFEGRFWSKEEEEEGWRDDEDSRSRNYQKVKPYRREARQKESSWSRRRGKGGREQRSSSPRPARRGLFRSESQGVLEPRAQREEPLRGGHWSSSLDVARGAQDFSVQGGGGGRASVGRKGEDKRLSSTVSLFLLSRSHSLEGSCPSLSPPLSSPSLSPSPPPRALARSRSLRDLGRRVFGSVRSLSLKHKTSKK